MPGVGMYAPMRYTASSASVKRTRFRKSGMRKMFCESFDESFHALSLRFRLAYATTSNVPPALVIFSLADALKACA